MTAGTIRRAEIVAVGSELLGVDRTDTNSLDITRQLNDLGVDVVVKAVVGDRRDDLADVCRVAFSRADLVVLTGGLGPTEDDVTRDAVSQVLGRPMREDQATVERIRVRFASRGLAMPESNRRQAMVLEGATLLPNERGTAPGQWLLADACLVVLLPGPPREMAPMLRSVIDDVVRGRTRGERYARRSLRLVGRSESQFDETLKPLYGKWAGGRPPVDATILAATGMIDLRLRARDITEESAKIALARAAADVGEVLGLDVVGSDGESLEVVVGHLLRLRRLRLAVAESCTGGLVSSRLTDVPGSSDYFTCGLVAYSNHVKTDMLCVPEDLIVTHGAVSEPVAVAMAVGVRRMAGVDVGVGVTGIAGPGGGTDAKPVGTVAIAIDGPGDGRFVRTYLFPGDREMVKSLASTTAIDRLRRAIAVT